MSKEQRERAARWARRYADEAMFDAVEVWLKIAYEAGYRAGRRDAKKGAGSK